MLITFGMEARENGYEATVTSQENVKKDLDPVPKEMVEVIIIAE